MAKILTDKELLDIVRRAIEHDDIDDRDQYSAFISRLAEVVVDHFGGEVGGVSFDPDDDLGTTVAIHWDDSVPEGGGIYALYDTEADFGPEDP